MFLATINNKLVFLLAIIFLGFSAIGYEIIKEANDAKMAAIRLTTIAEIENATLELRIQQRDYQIYFKPVNLENYEKTYRKHLADLDELKTILMSSSNHKRIETLKSLLIEAA